MILEDHLIKGSCDFMAISPSRYFSILLSLLTIGLLVVESSFFSLSHDLDIITSPAPAWLVSFESKYVDVPACQIYLLFGDHRSYRTGDVNSYNSYFNLQKMKL